MAFGLGSLALRGGISLASACNSPDACLLELVLRVLRCVHPGC